MKIADLTTAQVQRYFESRLQGVKPKEQQLLRCPFHEDSTPSLSVNLKKMVWSCKTGCGSGGLIEFETRFSQCDESTAWDNILEAIGAEGTNSIFREKPEAVYRYTDELGNVLYEKLRFPGKKFRTRQPDGKGGHIWKIEEATRRVLYNLPALVTANQCLIAEGEKDCNNVAALNLAELDKTGATRLAVTTNYDGAGKWRVEYAPYFAGKSVAILPDCDAPGMKHAETVAASVYPYALSVRIVELPDLPPKGDVSDYLKTHTREQLVAEIKNTPLWVPKPSAILVNAKEFLRRSREEIEWLIEGVIQRGANGFIVAGAKTGKSWVALDMAICLSLGLPWLEFRVTRPCRSAVITREDNPGLTQWRMNRLLRGAGKTEDDLGDMLWINSKDQSPQFKLDNPEQLAEMMVALRALRPEFVILDVLNVLHSKDENDNTEMRAVLDCAESIHRELKCSLCILHHFNKAGTGRLTDRMRGAGAMAGFAEWIIGIEFATERPDEKIRYLEFDLKAASPHSRVYYEVWSDDEQPALGNRVQRVDYEGVQTQKRGRRHIN